MCVAVCCKREMADNTGNMGISFLSLTAPRSMEQRNRNRRERKGQTFLLFSWGELTHWDTGTGDLFQSDQLNMMMMIKMKKKKKKNVHLKVSQWRRHTNAWAETVDNATDAQTASVCVCPKDYPKFLKRERDFVSSRIQRKRQNKSKESERLYYFYLNCQSPAMWGRAMWAFALQERETFLAQTFLFSLDADRPDGGHSYSYVKKRKEGN